MERISDQELALTIIAIATPILTAVLIGYFRFLKWRKKDLAIAARQRGVRAKKLDD
jgi:hypothetical protein